ncbi:hypothetical protein SLEP1_g52201 [Rubroshorea leprosula]|uniref:Uncharacterized protein n=1 Tax=Rubroshorea leprosula TaxID=152421 RepID=A0AAV5M865_9ROSI|nr:hypothetical protein SLEP1_g52201 [Rubroshorea leprosula]
MIIGAAVVAVVSLRRTVNIEKLAVARQPTSPSLSLEFFSSCPNFWAILRSIFSTHPSLMAISISACATPHWTNSSKQCKFVGQYVRALPIRIITVGKKRSPGVQLLVDGFIDKLRNYCPVDDVLIRSNPKNARDVRARVDDEDMAVMNHIRGQLDCIKGKDQQMAKIAQQLDCIEG